MIECPQSVNNFGGDSVSYTALKCIVLFRNRVFRGQFIQYVLVYYFTNMDAVSHRTDFFACIARVNIYKPGYHCTISLLLADTEVRWPRFYIPAAMSESTSLNTLILEIMMTSKKKPVLIRDLSDLTLLIIFDAWWASMNEESKHPTTSNNSRYVSSCWFYLHCQIEETGSPGIICIVCHQVLYHLSEHGTSSMGKHLLAKAQISNFNELTESGVTELTSSTVNETTLAMLKRQGSWGFTIVSSQRKFIFDVQVDPNWPKLQAKCSKLAAKNFQTSEFHQDRWNCYLMLGFVSPHIRWNTISNLQLWQSYEAIRSDLVLASAPTYSIISWRE